MSKSWMFYSWGKESSIFESIIEMGFFMFNNVLIYKCEFTIKVKNDIINISK